ncbi:MAG: hypothetical protein QG657_1450 [Acidobacteriota bacterium]|nr:hypothetical protein [Acidobacteriota bacterium]
MRVLSPPHPKDRFDVYRFFNGQSQEAKEGLDRRQTRVPLVKTFLLEHVASRGNGHPKSPGQIFKELGADIKMLDENFMALSFNVYDDEKKQTSNEVTGFLEQYDERFFAYYTCEESIIAKKRTAKWILSPDLDHAWFSSPLLHSLWNQDVSKRGDDRFCKLVFKHESIFDMPQDFSMQDETTDEAIDETVEEEEVNFDEHLELERRKARFEMGDRIGSIKCSLDLLMENYSPLHVLNAIRFPSRIGRGGHELYQTGQITNRTDSFEDHRNTVRYLYCIYKSILEYTEKFAWQEIDAGKKINFSIKGVPLIVKFIEPLSDQTFNRWIQMAFQKRNRFKLWGDPIRLGPSKVHVYGADRHLWQPINLELTSKGIVAILPQGTCGNTFHRLIANIQHYVCPKIDAWIGSETFENIVGKWSLNTEETREDSKID